MELGLGVVVPASGARADVLVRACDGAPLESVAPLLLARVLADGGGGRLSVGGRAVDAGARLGVPPLVEGAVLRVDGRTDDPAETGVVELRVIGGPGAGTVHRLAPGTVTIGRDPSCTVTLDDPDVSRTHCRLTVEHAVVRVADLGSTNGTTVDGSPVTEAELAYGAVLRVGSTRLGLAPRTPSPAPVTASGAGWLGFNRQPRLRPPREVVQVVVPAPPAERERSTIPVLAVLAPLVLGVVMWRVTGSTTFLLFTLLSPLLVLGNVVTERRTGRRRTRRDTALWKAQREVAERTLTEAVRDDEQERRVAAPDPAEVLLTALGPLPRLWERRRSDDDVLELRLGLADLPARVEAEGDLREGSTTARDVPVLVPLREAGVVGLAGDRARAQSLARWLLAQAAVWHSPRDLSVVVLAEPTAAPAWEWVRWLPHARPDGGQDCRALLGLTPSQVAVRVGELRALVAERRDDRAAPRLVLVVVDGARALRAVPGLAELLAEGPAVGVHAVCVEPDPRLLPEECGATALLAGAAVEVQVTGRPVVTATADLVSSAWAERVARALAPLRDHGPSGDGADGLPVAVRWTDVVGVPLEGGDADVARVLARWSSPGRSTTAALGRGPDGVFSVDLSRDGPHGLVAGTTGSGKSELLQTLIASLALANRPDELTFVLVDYKGGAAFGPCARLPHTVGMVTDLDGSLVERALASLHAELARREAVLAATGAKDVEDHRRRVGTPGGPREVLPRLVLVVDEFASLVEDLPDFVGGLVGIAMRGRSLGVHLVLATQRPEGVVSADIRANANLRLCLAVTRDAESRDVLDSPAAAAISRTTPGRVFARTGAAELTPFQAGRVGGRRPAVVTADETPRVDVLPAADLGDPLPRGAADDEAPDEVTDLSLLVDACVAATDRLRLPPQPSPWLPPLPELVHLTDLPAVDDPLAGVPGRVPALPYALVDVPGQQARRTLALDLDRSTHLMVVGSARSGRTTVLRTLAGSLAATASPDDVHLYALDPGGGGLAPLTALPHTGAVVPREQPQRAERVLMRLAAEVARRQAALSAHGHSDLAEQRAAAPADERLPHLLLLLDRWEAFLAAFAEVDGGRLVDLVLQLLREGPSVGLHVVITADRSGLVGRLSSLVPDTLLLRMADRGDYAGAGVPTRLVPGSLPPGRGWQLGAEPRVAQVALLPGAPTGPAQAAALQQLAGPGPRLHRPWRVEPLPSVVHRRELPAHDGRRVALGLGGDELEPVVADLSAGFLIGGPPGSGKSSALLLLAGALRAAGTRVVTLAPRPSPLRELPGCLTSRDAAGELEAALGDGDCALLVDDAELLVDSALAYVLESAVRDARDRGTTVVAAGATDELVLGYRGFVVDLRRARTGLLLSPQAVGDGDLLGLRLSRSTGGPVHPGRGLLVRSGRADPVQVAAPG